MRHIQIQAKVRNRAATQIYPILCDFTHYSDHSDAVQSVSASVTDDGRTISSWEVNFDQGLLRWTEEDRFNPETHTIYFRQLYGDADHFSGEWVIVDNNEGCFVQFKADLDLGIPGLSDILHPIAERALYPTIRSILTGLLGEAIEFIG